jgi:hypothetical protein
MTRLFLIQALSPQSTRKLFEVALRASFYGFTTSIHPIHIMKYKQKLQMKLNKLHK